MHYVIVGNSAAAVGAVESIRKIDQVGEITLIGDEPYHTYSRPMIAHLLACNIENDRISYRPEDFYNQLNVQCKLGCKATDIDISEQVLCLGNEEKIKFDQLLICTGSSVSMPQLKGIELEGVTTFQGLADAYYLKKHLGSKKSMAVVIGGGFIGLRAAQSLRKAGTNVVMLVRSRIMRRVLDVEGSAMAESLLQAEGIEIIKGGSVQEIRGEGGRVASVVLGDGNEIACNIVVIATGVTPNLELVVYKPIKINRGIVVNRYMQTTYSNIYAAGDVAETYDIPRGRSRVNSNWPNAHEQGRVAGLNIAGDRVPYQGSLGMNVISINNVPFMSMGISDPEGENETGYEIKTRKNKLRNIYQKLVFKDNRLKGAIFIGDLGYCGAVKELIREQVLVGIIKDSILFEKYQLYGFLRKKREADLEGKMVNWPETYTYPTPYRKNFDEQSWTERERNERKWL